MQEEFARLDAFLADYDKIILSTHENPDWDGLGGEVAMFELLKSMGKTALIINSDPTPETFRFLDPDNDIHVMDGSYRLPDDIREYGHIVLDTNDYSNIGRASIILGKVVREIMIIDHHDGEYAKLGENIIKTGASSVCELIYHIIRHYDRPITLRAAQALFAGIVYDTGSFVYPKTSAETFRIAAHLEELGVVPSFIHEQIYEQNALSSFELRSRILATMEVLYGGRLVAMKLTREMLMETGAAFTEGEPAINLPLTVRGVVASVLVKQDIDGPVKVSLRTKGELDVARVAMENGGGGHRNAAGYKSSLTLEKAYSQAITNMGVFFDATED